VNQEDERGTNHMHSLIRWINVSFLLIGKASDADGHNIGYIGGNDST
jgi:hypothetical protein